jgi:hypothetical protein
MPDSLTPDVTEQLLDLREADGGRHAAVTALLVAAAGPALPGELTGEDSALHAFRSAYRARRRRRIGLFSVAAAAILSLGGTAYAAGGDHLPDPVQRTVDALFGGRHDTAPSTAPGPTGSPPGSPGSTAGPSPSAPADGVPADRVLQLCRAWEAARADPHAPEVSGEDRRELAQAAKNANGIDTFCRGVLGGPTPTPTATSAPGQQGTAKPGNADPNGGASRTHPVRPSHP